MENFIYRSVTVLPSEEFRVKYKMDPNVTEKFGGVITCRSSPTVHPIPNFIPNLSAPNFTDLSNVSLTPPLPPRCQEAPPHPTSHLSFISL